MHIIILNTGCSNLSSINWAIQRLGYSPKVTRDVKEISHADKLIIPGVGTASTVMECINQHKLIDVIKTYKKPILGICLGFQLFCSSSAESKTKFIKTLNIINEPVALLQTKGLPLPHIGWNQIIPIKSHVLFKGITQNSRFYFLHSYAVTTNPYTIATTYYGQKFTSVIQKNNFFGVQFHPEKSGIDGSILLKNFLEM
ncbi:imidazole glycerol phosphate synthase subunit HisH [Buchnera aphidicola (Hormaphis cornu)]|nr:imidazole glycerol phosphate synthase subunit HisH [Buchnera aphidicola (Hormaphis cornu)]